jgi:hypothetical protein
MFMIMYQCVSKYKNRGVKKPGSEDGADGSEDGAGFRGLDLDAETYTYSPGRGTSRRARAWPVACLFGLKRV